MFSVSHSSKEVCLKIEHLWDGSLCVDERLWADVSLVQNKQGLLIKTRSLILGNQNIPQAPTGTRVEGLWNYDVVEVFLVGPGHQYLEIELGAGGHFLVLGFDSIRHCSHTFEMFYPQIYFKQSSEHYWSNEILIPYHMIPENIRAINAFAILSGQFLAYAPVPGEKPDFHQPDHFPFFALQ
ncbi:MAG: hypothetical protein UT30_C0010G0029 [Candidatus Uhrbacteria bacterium GW2011_GWF2_39_13]|uniref:Uncharacterized protein n=1 Tax=Candidatus Uhrbacteria bacterium GW2011_GWF2_39_13 TaxID=1618995 RepID=A0A0G0Q1H0_9BACT|nr:MAG: hypothetical protein UT30_C0010G0029 [Candidatus Uhrbacteria bacterium GW2011_GWF2_39_13]HAU65809.1 hypothetical protein [Candidatus Uhrbacteria bacterium]